MKRYTVEVTFNGTRKICAIKDIRAISGADLKGSKDAVEAILQEADFENSACDFVDGSLTLNQDQLTKAMIAATKGNLTTLTINSIEAIENVTDLSGIPNP